MTQVHRTVALNGGWRRRSLVGVSVASVLLATFLLASHQDPLQEEDDPAVVPESESLVQGNAGLTVAESQLDFGEVWQQDGFRWMLEVANTTDHPIEIGGFETDCACTAIDPKSVVVPARGSSKIRLTLTLIPRQPMRVWPFRVRVSPLIGRAPAQIAVRGWEVRGNIRSAFRIAEYDVRFGGPNAVIRGSPPPSTVLGVTCFETIKQLRAVPTDPATLSADVTVPGDGGEPWRIRVTPTNEIPEGLFRTELKVLGTLADGTQLPAVPLRVRGESLPDVSAFPNRVCVGTIAVGNESEARIELVSHAGAPFRVGGVLVKDDGLESAAADGLRDAFSSRHTVRVTKRFLKPGLYAGTIELSLLKPDGARTALAVPLDAYVVQSAHPSDMR